VTNKIPVIKLPYSLVVLFFKYIYIYCSLISRLILFMNLIQKIIKNIYIIYIIRKVTTKQKKKKKKKNKKKFKKKKKKKKKKE